MPSTVSSVVSRPFASSTVMTPSLPTFSIASAIRLPISLSFFAEIAPTWAISFRPAVGTEIFFRSSTTASTARSMPRFNDIGLAPAVTDFRPSRKIACASTVAVVVPSPARSDVLVATSFTIWAPIFSISSSSSISLATVTPSLVTVGLPNFFSMTTLRPLGPSVTFTASASLSTPRFKRARAPTLNSRYFAAIVAIPPRPCSGELGDDVGFLDEDDFLTIQLDLRAAILSVDHAIPHLQLHRDRLTFFSPAGTHRDDFALDRLLLGGVGDVEPALHHLRLLERPNGHTIGERKHLQLRLASSCWCHGAMPPPVYRTVNRWVITRLALSCDECLLQIGIYPGAQPGSRGGAARCQGGHQGLSPAPGALHGRVEGNRRRRHDHAGAGVEEAGVQPLVARG